jgi:hypothetical protein
MRTATTFAMPAGAWWLPIVAFNLVPIAGVLWLGWDLALILVLYWAENGLVGLANLVKILAARGSVADELLARTAARRAAMGGWPAAPVVPTSPRPVAPPGTMSGLILRLGTATFFAFHYGLFWAVHGIFVFLIASGGFLPREPQVAGLQLGLPGSFWVALGGLVVLRLVDLGRWYRDRDYERISPLRQSGEPYRRVIALHLAIVLGGVLVVMLGEPLMLLVVLVAVKIVIELGLERRAAAGQMHAS